MLSESSIFFFHSLILIIPNTFPEKAFNKTCECKSCFFFSHRPPVSLLAYVNWLFTFFPFIYWFIQFIYLMILFQGKYLANGKIRGGNIYGG